MKEYDLDNFKIEVERYYKNIGDTYCPYFKDNIAFNQKGLKHIKFKSDGEARSRSDQFIRLKNIKFAKSIVSKSSTLQEFRSEPGFVGIKTHGRREKVLKQINYYGFISIVKDGKYAKRFRIIIRQIEGGNKHFYSIIPFWKRGKGVIMYYKDISKH